MLGLKRETDYAVQLLNFLSTKKDKFSSLRVFAKESKISFWFLQKIARKLHLAGLVEAEQGVNGGYRLKKQSKNLSLYKVFEVMEGKLCMTPCLKDENFACAGKNRKCVLKKAALRLNKEIIKAMQKIKAVA